MMVSGLSISANNIKISIDFPLVPILVLEIHFSINKGARTEIVFAAVGESF